MRDYDADVIIIGAGALGANAAYRLAKAGKSVIMLEAGSTIPRWKIVGNYRNSPTKRNWNAPYPNLPWAPHSYAKDYIKAETDKDLDYAAGFIKISGGTTHHWSAACWRLLPNDFKLKSVYGVGRDWPISYDDLEKWYWEAEKELGVSGTHEEDQSGTGHDHFPPRSVPYPLPPEAKPYMLLRMQSKLGPLGYQVIHEPHCRLTRPYDGRPACIGSNNCEAVCPTGAMYSGNVHIDKALALGMKLLTEAVAFKLEKGENNRITAVHYRTPDKTDHRLTAKIFIVAAHAMETAKLLLMSDVANSSDQVGRNYMDHAGLNLSFLADEALWTGRGSVQHGSIVNRRDEKTRSVHASTRYSFRNLAPNQDVTPALLRKGLTGKELDNEIRDYASRFMNISTMSEMLPSPGNRIAINNDYHDSIGLPGLNVSYYLDDYIRNAQPQTWGDFTNFLKAFSGQMINSPTRWRNRFHVMGTTIMGDKAENSVVNADCRTWDHDNLFLATTGVMASSASVSPTLTGIALAIRIGEQAAAEV